MSAHTPTGEAIRHHHREIADGLTRRVEALLQGGSALDEVADLVEYLRTELLPHAASEERILYPVLDALVRRFSRPTAPMSLEHELIARTAREIEMTAAALSSAPHEDRLLLKARLLTLSVKLEHLHQLHFEKEERVYLPLFEEHLTDEDQRRLLHGLHAPPEPRRLPIHEPESVREAARGLAGRDRSLDVREVPSAFKHPLIFRAFEALPAGEAFVLVNDHDPKPLFYQFQAEHPGEFTWEYLERGPDLWRVAIGKPVEGEESGGGCCGGRCVNDDDDC
jgi:uncharacterized protein (DUF2249 family)/hemerythrin-like domain-containing protein